MPLLSAAPNSNIDPLAQLQATTNAAQGHADPKTIVGVANHAQSTDEATTNIQAIINSGNMVKMYDTLGRMDISHQAQAWGELSNGEQGALKTLGYKPPSADVLSHSGAGGSGGGIWGDLTGWAGDAARDVWNVGQDVNVGHLVGQGLHAANAPLSAVQHVYRAARYQAEYSLAQRYGWNYVYGQASGSGASLGHLGTQFDNIFNFGSGPGGWGAAWDHTANGNTQIDPSIYRHLVGVYGSNRVNAALSVVAAGSPDNYIASLPQNQRQSVMTQVADPKFQSLVTQVSNARMSTGRSIVGERALTQHPGVAHAVSGTIDAATDILSDPTLKIGKIAEAAKLARWAVGSADDAKALMGTRGFQGYLDKITPYVENRNWGGLVSQDARFAPLVEDLSKNNIDSRAKLVDWFANQGGMKAILTGDAAKQTGQSLMLPHVSYLGWGRDGVKSLFSNTIDHLNDARFSKGVKLAGEDVFGAGDHVALGATDQRVADAADLLEKGKMAGGPGNLPLVRNVNRLLKATTTYIPTKSGIGYGAGEADVTNFRRYIQGFLPSGMVDNLTTLFTDADEAQRRTLIEASMKQQAHAAGLYNTAESASAADKMFATISEQNRRQAYGVNGYDRTPDSTGVFTPHAIYSTQTSKIMRIPLPAEMRRIARMNSMLTIAGVHPMNVADRLMMYWRSLILDRPGFAVRIGLDENLNRLLRLGPKGFVGSFFANGAKRTMSDEEIASQVEEELAKGSLMPADAAARTRALTALSYKQALPYHPVDRALQALADRAPEGARQKWKSIEEFYGGVMGGMTRTWARKGESKALKALSMNEYVDAATHLAQHQPISDEAIQDIVATTTGAQDFTVTPAGLVSHLRRGDTGKMAFFRKAGPYSQAGTGDPLFMYKWQTALDQIARSPEGQAVLHSLNMSREDQIRSVLHVLRSEDFAEAKSVMDRSIRGRNGLVGRDASQDAVDRDWAESIVDNTNAHLRAGNYDPNAPGRLIQELVDHMKEEGAGPDHEMLEDVMTRHQTPAAVVGPDMIPEAHIQGMISRSFEEMVGKPLNWMVRQPHLIHQYTIALKEARDRATELGMVYKDGSGLTKEGEQYASDLALHRAHNAVIPFIHNPELRTQFEDLHRNLFPFLFAQRQFLMRWGRTFEDSPSAIRELQLGMNALRTTGVVKKDANGNDYFYYPGSQYVTEMVTHTLNRLGIHATVPFAVPFTGQVQYLMPGLSNPTTPSVGPFAAIGLKQLAKIFPEMDGFNQGLLGQGAAESAWQQFMPTLANRVYESFIDKLSPNEAGSQLASSTVMMMKYMDANGQGLPQDAKPGQIEQYVDRLTTGARDILLVRAALGFVLPSTPTAQLDPQGLDARYKELIQILPYDKALQQFYKEHPNAVAYTVGSTTGATSGNIPATTQDLQYTNQHVQFAKDYPAAFPWLAPRSPGQFNLTEFLEQESTGQRTPLPVWDKTYGAASALANIMNAKASQEYYAAVDQYDQAYASTTDTNMHRQQTVAYDDWKQGFRQRNPVFAQYLDSQRGKENREATINQVRQALSDPQLPNSPAVPGLKTMLSAFDQFKAAYTQYLGINTTAGYDTKVAIKNQTIAWGNDYIKSHPQVADFWNTILRPEVDESSTTVG